MNDLNDGTYVFSFDPPADEVPFVLSVELIGPENGMSEEQLPNTDYLGIPDFVTRTDLANWRYNFGTIQTTDELVTANRGNAYVSMRAKFIAEYDATYKFSIRSDQTHYIYFGDIVHTGTPG